MLKSSLMKTFFVSIAALLLMSFTYVGVHENRSEKTTKNVSKKSAGATITGTVTYEGKVPKLKALDMGSEPTCAAKHSTPAKSQALVLGAGNKMANIFVKVKNGLAETKYDAPKEPFVVDQNGCVYEPHVFGVMAGQPIKFLNSDGVLHNV
ncbi:MAG: hypothetical protein ACE5I1_14015, partial [bacterium]